MSAVKHAARTAAAVFVLGLSVTASPAVALADTTEEAAPASEAADSAATSISGRTAAPKTSGPGRAVRGPAANARGAHRGVTSPQPAASRTASPDAAASLDLPAADLPLPDLPTLADGLDLLAGLVDPSQLASLQGLDPALLAAIDALDDRQVLALALLTPDQLAALRGVPADQLGATLDRIIAGSLDPASLLDQPLLPPSGRGPGSGGGGDRGAGGIGSGLAGVLAGGGR